MLPGDQTEPALSGQRIVWTDMRNEPGGGDIYLYDMSASVETPACVEKGQQMRPKISGDSVVWMDFRSGNPEVYLYNILSGQVMRISRDNFIADAPLLSGNLAVWQEYSVFDRRDERMGTIVVYDTTTGNQEILPTETQYPQLLALNNNRILYANPDARTMEEGFVHLYVLDVPKPPSFSPAATSHPMTAQETPTMVFGPAKTVTRSAPMSPYLAPFSFLVFAMVLRIRNCYGNK
jgi:beta propeller repeat protein